jgi:hypothetical protein
MVSLPPGRGFIARAGILPVADDPVAVTMVSQDFNGTTADVLAAGWYNESLSVIGSSHDDQSVFASLDASSLDGTPF